MDVPFDRPGADSPHNSFSGAEIFVSEGGGADGGGGGPNDDGRFHTSGITMYEEVDGEVQRRTGGGCGSGGDLYEDQYEDRYVDDQGGYGHSQNPAAYRHRDHDGAAGYGGEDDFGGGGGGVDPRGGGIVGPAYHEEDYDDDQYNDIGFDGRDLRSEPSRSSSSRSLLSKQSRSSSGSRSMASSSRQSYDSRRDPQMHSQYQNQSHYHQSHYEDQPRYADDGRMGGFAEEEEYYYDDESKFGGNDSLYGSGGPGGGQPQSVVTDYSNYHPDGEGGDDLPCISLAGYELDSMKFAQRRHVSYLEQTQAGRQGGGGGKGGQTILDEFSDIPLPSRQSYPADCLQILRLLDSNGGCVDCGAGLDGQTDPPMWASISYGTLLCDKCAFVHLTKSEEKAFKHMSAVKHLDTGYWTMPEVLTMLEGGNGNFLLAVQGNKQMRRPSGLERRATQRLGKAGKLGMTGLAPIDEEGGDMPGGDWRGGPGRTGAGGLAKGGLFEAKYKNKQASSYCATLQQRVQAVCGAFECNRGLPFDVAQQDQQVDQFLERPAPAKVRLRDPPTREEILQAKMDASRMSKSRGDSTISGSSRFGTNTTRSSGASSRNVSSARSKASSGMRSSISSKKSKATSSGAPSRWSSSAGSSRQADSSMGSSRQFGGGDETSRTRRGSNEDRRAHQPSQIHTIYEEDGQSEISSQPSRRASNESSKLGSTLGSTNSAKTGRDSKAPSASSSSAKKSSKATREVTADPPSSPAPENSAGPCPPPTKLVRRASDPARVPNYSQDKKNKMRKKTKRQKKQDRRRRASLP